MMLAKHLGVNLTWKCQSEACRSRCRIILQPSTRAETTCPTCGQAHHLTGTPAQSETSPITRCYVCGGAEFFIRKDFPQKLGLALVVIFALAATIFYYYENVPATFGTLAMLVVVDAIIYLFVGKVTVCYRCRAEYRGVGVNPAHAGFDLATSEKYPAP